MLLGRRACHAQDKCVLWIGVLVNIPLAAHAGAAKVLLGLDPSPPMAILWRHGVLVLRYSGGAFCITATIAGQYAGNTAHPWSSTAQCGALYAPQCAVDRKPACPCMPNARRHQYCSSGVAVFGLYNSGSIEARACILAALQCQCQCAKPHHHRWPLRVAQLHRCMALYGY